MSKPVFEDLWSFSGRRNRLSFLLVGLAQIAGFVVLFGIVMAAAATRIDAVLIGAAAICAVAFVALTVSGWAVSSQRCRDFGWTGWAALITIVPYVGWLFAVALLFIPGTDGDNRYGGDPIAARHGVCRFEPGRYRLPG